MIFYFEAGRIDVTVPSRTASSACAGTDGDVAFRGAYSEYDRFERQSRDRHEYVAGAILATAGGTLEHGAVAAALIFRW